MSRQLHPSKPHRCFLPNPIAYRRGQTFRCPTCGCTWRAQMSLLKNPGVMRFVRIATAAEKAELLRERS